MSNFTIDPVTGINIPTPGLDPGPEYATFISNGLSKLCSLTHTGQSNLDGYQIPSAGINFNADISAQSNNLTNLRSARFNSQTNVLSGVSDLDCIYVKSDNLYFNNGTGTPVQITAAGIVNATVTSNYKVLAVANNLTIGSSSTTNLFECDSTADVFTLTLPQANAVAAGRFYIFKDVTGQSQTHNITISAAGTDQIDGSFPTTFKIADNYHAVMFVSDGVSNWMVFHYSKNIYAASSLVFNSGTTLAINDTSVLNLNGTSGIVGSSTSNITTTGHITLNSAGLLTVASGATLSLTSSAQLLSAVGAVISLAAFPTFGSPQTRTVVQVMTRGYPTSGVLNTDWGYTTNAVQALTTLSGKNWVTPLDHVHNGATLSTVSVSFSVGAAHSSVPSLPTISIQRYLLGQYAGVLSTIDPQPFTPTPASGAAWYNSGNIQTLTYTCNQNNVIDTTQYTYHLILTDEFGASAHILNTYADIALNHTNITSLKWAM